MVAMDPDTEFNSLSALYQSVVADMKSSYPAWETVAQRAQKLSASLRTTVGCLAAFNDAVQQVSDLANNLKGASRDVGACVTRICMRQRALEGRLKSISDALADELSVTVHQRTAFWKQRTVDMDKAAARHVKKVRGRKSRPDDAAVSTQRGLCAQLLQEQRAQFAFFLNALLPVLTSEVALLDEASHIRPSVESLETTMTHVDSETLVHTILADLTQGAESAWRSALASSASSAYIGSSTSSEEDPASRLASPSIGYAESIAPSDADLTPQYAHNQQSQSLSSRRAPPDYSLLSSSTPPSSKPLSLLASSSKPPPLSGCNRRLSSTTVSSSTVPSTPTTEPALASFRSNATETRPTRPQSFTGELRGAVAGSVQSDGLGGGGGGYAGTPLVTPSIYATAAGVYGMRSSSYGETATERSDDTNGGLPNSCSSSSETTSMIAETLQQIDRLGTDLDSFCGEPTTMRRVNGDENTVTMRAPHSGPVRVRPDYTMSSMPPSSSTSSSSSRPAPPERRSSQITCATPSAPSVAEARLSRASSSLGGSRQSLTSTNGHNRSSTCSSGANLPPPPAHLQQGTPNTTTSYGVVGGPGTPANNSSTFRQPLTPPTHYAATNVSGWRQNF